MGIKEIIEGTALFGELGPRSLDGLAKVAVDKRLDRNQILFHEGQEGAAVYVVVEGSVRLDRSSPEGKEVVIKVVRPGELFGEVILFERTTYPVTATALVPTHLVVLPLHQVRCLLDDPSFRDELIAALMRKQRYLVDTLRHRLLSSIRDRLFAFLRGHYGEVTAMVPDLSKRQIAEAIGVTAESLSRTLHVLKKEGILSWDNDGIVIADGFWEGWSLDG